MLSYPTSPPLDAVTSLLTIVKSGSIPANKAAFALAVWNVQGYLQNRALGSTDAPVDHPIPVGAQPVHSIHNAEDAAACAIAFEAHLNANVPGVTGALPIPWAMLTPLIKWALTQLIGMI